MDGRFAIAGGWAVVTVWAALGCGCDAKGDSGSKRTWNADLQAAPTGGATVAGTLHPSSTRLAVTWSAAAGEVDHYEVDATGSGRTVTVGTAGSAVTLEGLASDTPYSIGLRACLDPDCAESLSPTQGTVSASTPEEVWQLQGTGSAVQTLTKVVSDGNVKIHAFRYGGDAPAGLAGRVQLYYGPSGMSVKGLTVGTSGTAATEQISSVLSFSSLAGVAGLISPSSPATLVSDVATGQAVPLSVPLGSKVRLYFEAKGADNKTRILYLDSQDGYVGRDFHAGGATVCSTAADYGSGGGCAPMVAIGVQGDATNPASGIPNVRQFKIGVPTLTDWRWDGAAGTFMVFTVDALTGCSTAFANQGYAVWNGTAWSVQYEDGGCPRLFQSAQAAMPMHLGGVRYKMYFGNPSDTTGIVAGSTLPFLGPKRIVYADGARSGDPARIDFDDWETTAEARDVTFLWPSGAALSAGAEGYIDDFAFLAPTASLDFQVAYVAITDGTIVPFTAAAVLVNP